MLSHVLGGPAPENCHVLLDELERTRSEIMERPDAYPQVLHWLEQVHDHEQEGAVARFERELIDALIAELPSEYRAAIGKEKERLEMLYSWPNFRRANEIAAGLRESVCGLLGANGGSLSALASQDSMDAARAASEITLGSESWSHKQVINMLLYAWGEHPCNLNLKSGNETSEFNRVRQSFDEVKTKTVKPNTLPIQFNNAVRNRLVGLLPLGQRNQYSSLINNPNLATDYALKKGTVVTWLYGAAVQLTNIKL